MEDFWQGFCNNRALWTIVASAITAQGLKTIVGIIRGQKFNFYWLLGTGGMPSAHSASVSALVFSVSKEAGSSSVLFALSIVFALMTMFDAQTWRRSIGFQAKILNKMIEDLQERKKIKEDRLRELVGHTPVEVLMGVVVGLGVANIFYL